MERASLGRPSLWSMARWTGTKLVLVLHEGSQVHHYAAELLKRGDLS